MSNDHDDLRPTDAPLDALLRERLGGESAPDVTHAVAERHTRGEGGRIAALLDSQEHVATRGNNRPLLTAAMIMLGIGAVLGTVWSVQDQSVDNTVQNSGSAKTQQGSAKAQQPEQRGIEAPFPQGKPAAQDPDPQNPLAKRQDPQPQRQPGKLSISVKVVDRHGGPIQDFEVEVLNAASKEPQRFGMTTAIPSQKRHPRDFKGDFTTIEGVRPGSYIVAVEDGMHAPTLSDPFHVVDDGKVPQVVVRMNNGGMVRGTVVDSQGRAIAGATVQASPSILPAGNPLESFLKNLQPKVHKPRTATSDRDGRFEFPRLVPGKYIVRAQHKDFSTNQADAINVEQEAKQSVKVTLQTGARIVGRVTRAGKPAVGYEVRVTTLRRADKVGANFVAYTDALGNFELPDRVAPGRYRIQAMSREAGNENPFARLLELKESQMDFEIENSDRKVEQNIDFK